MADRELKFFYNSKEWKRVQQEKIASVNFRCEECDGIAEEVHHKVPITTANVFNVDVTLNTNNLVVLCRKCHNEKHHRFRRTSPKFDKDGNVLPY